VQEDWATQATDTIEQVVGVVRDKTVVPARAASKAVVYGLLAAFFVAVAVILLIIAFFRGAFIVTGRVWGAYLWTGGILVIAGALCWTRRAPRSDETPS
jgi:drug/metabolite transporter (DMT)-like permease